MTAPANPLERALELFVRHQLEGGDWSRLVLAHPDLAELLESLRAAPDGGQSGDAVPDRRAAPTEAQRIGEYRLLREIGRGGIGVVFEAKDAALGRRVALKLLHAEFAADPTALLRFRREAQILARLDHGAIVRVLGVGEHEGRHWLAMEFVDGESLAARLEHIRAGGGHRGDSLRRLVEAMASVAEALQHAHDAGVVHRDVKPSNILLRPDGSAVLTDFGIARDHGDLSLTRTGAVVGTPHYLAPEQVRDGRGDARCDVFALGATLYECATLQKAFDGTSLETVLHAILTQDPPDPRRIHRGVSADLAAIVLKALEKDPALRYPDAGAFADDLRAFLELREVTARRPSLTQRWLRRLRRQPVVGAFAAAVAIAAVLLAWIAWQWPRLDAARALERQRAYDREVVAGFVGRGADQGRSRFEAAFALDPSRCEAVLGLTFAASRTNGPAAGLAELERRAGACTDDSIARCRAWFWDRTGRHEEAAALRSSLGPPRTATALWLEAMCCIEASASEPAQARRAWELLSLAVRIASQPNLLLDLQWTVTAVQLGDVAARREAAETLLTLWPEHPLALQQAGVALLKVDPARALETVQRAIECGGDDPLLRPNLGVALAVAGERDRAVQVIAETFAAPGVGSGHRAQLLLVLSQLGALDDADRLAVQWLDAEPDDPMAQRFAGRAASRRGDQPRALALLQAAAAARPGDVDVRLDLAQTLLASGDGPAAVGLLRELVATQPRHLQVHAQLLDALDELGDPEGGCAERARWADAQPGDAAAWRELAAALLQRPDDARLQQAFDAAERADYLAGGSDPVALELRADAVARRGDPKEADRLRARAKALRER